MDHKLKQYTLAGAVFTVALGFFLQFTYSWSSGFWLVGIFSPVNSSVWEQLKLLFIPMTLFSVFEAWMIADTYPRLLPARIYGLIGGLMVYLVTAYTYNGIIGARFWLLDFVSFSAAAGAAFLGSHWIQMKYRLSKNECEKSMMILIALLVCFVFFTFYHPQLALFTPKVSK